MCSRADDLNIRQDLILDFTLIYFLSPSYERKGQAGWSFHSGLSLFLFSVFSQKLRGKGGEGKVVLIVVEAEPASSKPPVGVDVRISTGEKHDVGASASSSTRASSIDSVRAGSSVGSSSPKLV